MKRNQVIRKVDGRNVGNKESKSLQNEIYDTIGVSSLVLRLLLLPLSPYIFQVKHTV